MYLNLYVPRLQTEKGVAHFWPFQVATDMSPL